MTHTRETLKQANYKLIKMQGNDVIDVDGVGYEFIRSYYNNKELYDFLKGNV